METTGGFWSVSKGVSLLAVDAASTIEPERSDLDHFRIKGNVLILKTGILLVAAMGLLVRAGRG